MTIETEINRNFLIRVTDQNTSQTTLKSARTYKELIQNDKLINKQFEAVLNNGRHKTTYKLRRGLKIDFCSK